MRTRVRHFSPARAGCQIALDARFLALSDNAAVSSWGSRTGGLYSATAAGTAQPTFKAASINGQPAVQFDGTSDCMDLDSGALGLQNAASGMLVIVVVVADNAAADATQNAVFFSSGSATSSTRLALRVVTSNAATANAAGRRLDADSVVATAGASGSTANPCILQGSADWAANQLACSVNGGTSATATFSSGAGTTSGANSLAAKVGGQATSSARLSGRIGALCIAGALLPLPLRRRIRQHYAFSFRIASA